VFSRQAFVWEGLDRGKIELIAPVIDAFSAKNQELDDRAVGAILHVAGLKRRQRPWRGRHVLARGRHAGGGPPSRAAVRRTAAAGAGPDGAAVSRWDQLKDPHGVIRGFVEHVVPHRTDWRSPPRGASVPRRE
jgi:trehalose synthase